MGQDKSLVVAEVENVSSRCQLLPIGDRVKMNKAQRKSAMPEAIGAGIWQHAGPEK
jgi:hypothetical protein